MWDQIQNRINKTTKTIRNALFGKISSVIKNENLVYVELSDEEEIRDVRILSPYGLYSIPTNDMFGQVIFNNSTKKATLIAVEDTGKPNITLDIGEVLIYNKIGNCYIVMKNDGSISVNGGTNNVARVGDSVQVTIGDQTYIGTITSGNNKFKA